MRPTQTDRSARLTFLAIPVGGRKVKSKSGDPTFPSTDIVIPREDVCQSKVEIVTPYWASNSNGKVRAILNNKEFEQAIHQEICRYF